MRYFLLLTLVLLSACDRQAAPTTEETTPMPERLPYGSWPSPISAASVVEGTRGLGSLSFDQNYLYWVESRPEEGGRNTIMRWRNGGEPEEILPPPWNARTRVQEYGGRSVLVAQGTVWFSNHADQRLYRLVPGAEPQPITPESGLRYAGCTVDTVRERLICVREDHRGLGEPKNTLVALDPTGLSEGEVLFDGADFVSAASISADGKHIAFTSWQHPNMPWDNTSLWSAGFDALGQLQQLTRHNPNMSESVINPQWSADSQLYAISDRDNWWQIYQVNGEQFTAIASGLKESEIGGPDWTIGQNFFHLLDDGNILAQVMQGGVEHAAMIHPDTGSNTPLALPSAAIVDILPIEERLYVINAFHDRPSALVETDMSGTILQTIRTSSDSVLDTRWVPKYEIVSFPSGDGAQAHGIYLPPTNPLVQAPANGKPPLIVSVHGGPTAAASPAFRLSHLFWTSRGFAVLDLNYRGSTGFGREYRRALYGQWGIADVEDAVAGANWLAQQGLADGDRLIIRGGSAGGYTTLAAHAFHDAFAAGASYFGVSDVEALASDTHKFESRYLDQLIGPYPERKDLYQQRSPIHHLQGFSAPLLLLQGLDDPIVPPNQSEMIFEALKSQGVATAYIPFEGEAHGFRKAENQIRAMQAELYFYAKVLNFSSADELPPIEIINLAPPGAQ